jgi:hypothetical protein
MPVVAAKIEPTTVVSQETSILPLVRGNALLEAAPSVSPDERRNATNCENVKYDGGVDIGAQVSEQTMKNDIPCDVESPPGHLGADVSISMPTGVDADVREDNTEGNERMTKDSHATSHDQEKGDIAHQDASSSTKIDVATEKRKQHTEDSPHQGPPRKKARMKATEKIRATSKQEGKRKMDEGSDDLGSVPRAKKQKKGDNGVVSVKRVSHSYSDASASTSKSSNSSHEASSSKLKQTNTDTPELDAEITGMLIECMATSRASSLPVSSLYKSVMECRPSLKAQRSEKEWVTVFRRVLRNGVVGSGVFGKVESSGKVSSFSSFPSNLLRSGGLILP